MVPPGATAATLNVGFAKDLENGIETEKNKSVPIAYMDLPDARRMQIVYKDLVYTVQVKKKKEGLVSKDIIKAISGVIQPARATAVVGASGAGKTTLLNVLAGYNKAGAKVGGEVSVNGLPMTADKMRQISGYVHQEDVVLHTMTVREALLFSAMLKLPGPLPRSAKVQRALDVASLLNLTKVLDNVVGSVMIKGISGGEKRRLSLGCEMVTNPSILFLDEPTSGLDSYTAYKVVRILHTLTHRHHRTVVCTIHQPSSEVFHMFDDLVVLAEGQVLYHGPTEAMVGWFSGLGYACPHYTNPADYLFMDILNSAALHNDSQYDFITNASGSEATTSTPGLATVDCEGSPSTTATGGGAARPDDGRIGALLEAWRSGPLAAKLDRQFTERAFQDTGISDQAIRHRAPFWRQFLLLAGRALKNSWRNPLIAKGKLAQTVFLSLVVGLIYLQVDDDLTGVQDRQGSLFFITVEQLFGSVMGIVTVFGAEKAVFQREYSGRLYGLPAYFLSRWFVELPSQIILPVLSSCIIYWMVGYQNQPDKFGWFALSMVLMTNCGASLGIFVACLFNDISVAMSVVPMFLLPLMVFSGFFVNSETIPPYFSWIQYISPMHYGFIAVTKNEFSGLEIHCTPAQDCAPGFDGDKVIENMGFDNKGSIQVNLGILFGLMWALLLLAYIALWVSVRRMGK